MPNGLASATAPWRGTIASRPANAGATLLPGVLLVMLADLDRPRVASTDADEFVAAKVRSGPFVTITVDALDQRELLGQVSAVAFVPEIGRGDKEFDPITIELNEPGPDRRPGLSVRMHVGRRENE